METNLKYVLDLLRVLELSTSNFYCITVYPTNIDFQGKYKADLVKKFIFAIDNCNGYLKYDGSIIIDENSESPAHMKFCITLTD